MKTAIFAQKCVSPVSPPLTRGNKEDIWVQGDFPEKREISSKTPCRSGQGEQPGADRFARCPEPGQPQRPAPEKRKHDPDNDEAVNTTLVAGGERI
jgi:hypothetical protein